MAMRARRDGAVAVGYLGDGATSENDFHSSLDLAARMAAPVVFFCQNNQWAISVPFERQTASTSVAVKARAYRMHGARVDGNDLFAVYQVMAEAVARARAGEGPTLIEALTYRMGAHSTSDDPSRYRDESITAAWQAKDPIARVERYCLAQGLHTEASLSEQTDALNAAIREVLGRVEAADPYVPLETLFEDVYREPPWFLQEQAEEAARFPMPDGH
jgi:pyruvate dehydrogenase E1 component alpha subunit/2-oxoisovalerate dehydrogenase E1 component alpha subunit